MGLELRRVLASSLRQNILRVLSERREMQVMALVSSTSSTYNEVNRNLAILRAEGVVVEVYRLRVRRGRVRVIWLDRSNPKTAALLSALKLLEQECSGGGCLGAKDLAGVKV